MSTNLSLQEWLRKEGQVIGADQAKRIARAALGLSPLDLLESASRILTLTEQEKLKSISCRHENHEPLSRILGMRGFWKEEFCLNAATLDPRPESEGIIEHALAYFQAQKPPQKILDLGTGTGCLLLSLLQEFPQAWGIGIDCSEHALDAAKINSKRLGVDTRVSWVAGNWLDAFISQPSFDLIVSNPPYISQKEMAGLPPEVQSFDPSTALDGGKDGLACYRRLIPTASRVLNSRGCLILEIGASQGQAVLNLLAPYFSKSILWPDLAGHDRYIVSAGQQGVDVLTIC